MKVGTCLKAGNVALHSCFCSSASVQHQLAASLYSKTQNKEQDGTTSDLRWRSLYAAVTVLPYHAKKLWGTHGYGFWDAAAMPQQAQRL